MYGKQGTAFPELDKGLYEAPKFRVIALRELWTGGSRFWHLAKPGCWTEHSREHLEAEAGALGLSAFLEALLTDEDVYVEALLAGEWVTASWWRLVEQYRWASGEGGGGPPSDSHRLAIQLKQVRATINGRKPELGETACHLVDHVGLSESRARDIAKLVGFAVYPSQWSQSVRNGRKRIARDRPCRYCP